MNISSKIVYGSWPHGGSVCYLVFVSNQQFRAVNGEIVQRGIYRKEVCVVTDEDITIPLVVGIPTTTDSGDPSATWDTYFEDSAHTQKMDWLKGFQLDHVLTSPTLWELIYDSNNPQGIPTGPEGVSYEQAVLLVTRLIDQITTDVLATGVGTLPMAEPVTILDSHVAIDSPIRLTPKVDMQGILQPFGRVAGTSFQVRSTDGSDVGNFLWEILP